MRVVIAGGHGKIGRLLGRLLAVRGDDAVGIVRNPDHVAELEADGIEGVLLDLEHGTADELAAAFQGADAAVFAAGAGPGSGAPRKDTVDRAAAVLVADAAQGAAVMRLIQISAMGVDRVRDRAVPSGIDPVFVAYLRAKLAAEEDLRGRRGLDWTILRPGRLTDQQPTGRIALADAVPRGAVPRADVAATLLALLDHAGAVGRVLEITSGPEPIEQAVAGVG
jgi:uncharacterized protein YbjT (DUF2867 family)